MKLRSPPMPGNEPRNPADDMVMISTSIREQKLKEGRDILKGQAVELRQARKRIKTLESRARTLDQTRTGKQC